MKYIKLFKSRILQEAFLENSNGEVDRPHFSFCDSTDEFGLDSDVADYEPGGGEEPVDPSQGGDTPVDPSVNPEPEPEPVDPSVNPEPEPEPVDPSANPEPEPEPEPEENPDD